MTKIQIVTIWNLFKYFGVEVKIDIVAYMYR